jgi:catechol 2,3-dioxygenase-like lactoylglutathione lyase family enzyme
LTAKEEPMPNTETPAAQPVYLNPAQPHVFVADIDAACAFYQRVLGFKILFKYGAPAFFASVCRDAAWLNLRHVDAPLGDPALRAREDYLSASINVSSLRELKQLLAEFTAAGADFHQPLTKHPWGGHSIIVKDPDGNLIAFGCGD